MHTVVFYGKAPFFAGGNNLADDRSSERPAVSTCLFDQFAYIRPSFRIERNSDQFRFVSKDQTHKFAGFSDISSHGTLSVLFPGLTLYAADPSCFFAGNVWSQVVRQMSMDLRQTRSSASQLLLPRTPFEAAHTTCLGLQRYPITRTVWLPRQNLLE